MGNTTGGQGASSGLHHDYHDNLYMSLRGSKHFRLYSPADAESMYLTGTLAHVHPNGRINYQGEETTAHGSNAQLEAVNKAKRDQSLAEQKVLGIYLSENGQDTRVIPLQWSIYK